MVFVKLEPFQRRISLRLEMTINVTINEKKKKD